MAERPIIFSASMVRAILDGRKSQTRRVLKPQPPLAPHHEPVRFETRNADKSYWLWMCCTDRPSYQFATGDRMAPYAIGDLLWVRESFRGPYPYEANGFPISRWGNKALWYLADGAPPHEFEWQFWPKARPSIHLPRWASRITLEVTDVRVQRVQEINEEDAIAEGMERFGIGWRAWEGQPHVLHARHAFQDCWNSLHAKRGFGWKANPWVAAVSFRTHLANIDSVKGEKE